MDTLPLRENTNHMLWWFRMLILFLNKDMARTNVNRSLENKHWRGYSEHSQIPLHQKEDIKILNIKGIARGFPILAGSQEAWTWRPCSCCNTAFEEAWGILLHKHHAEIPLNFCISPWELVCGRGIGTLSPAVAVERELWLNDPWPTHLNTPCLQWEDGPYMIVLAAALEAQRRKQ